MIALSPSHWAIIGVSIAGIALGITQQLRIVGLEADVSAAQLREEQCLRKQAEDHAEVMGEWMARQRAVLDGVAEERARLGESVDRAVARLAAVKSDWETYVHSNPLDPACRVDAGRVSRINAGRVPAAIP